MAKYTVFKPPVQQKYSVEVPKILSRENKGFEYTINDGGTWTYTPPVNKKARLVAYIFHKIINTNTGNPGTRSVAIASDSVNQFVQYFAKDTTYYNFASEYIPFDNSIDIKKQLTISHGGADFGDLLWFTVVITEESIV